MERLSHAAPVDVKTQEPLKTPSAIMETTMETTEVDIMADKERFLTPKALCRKLGISKKFLWKMDKQKRWPRIVFSPRKIYYDWEDVIVTMQKAKAEGR